MIRLLGLTDPAIDVSTPPQPPEPGTPEFEDWLGRPNEGSHIRDVRHEIGPRDVATILILATRPPADVARLLAVRERLAAIIDEDLTVASLIPRQMIETGSDRARPGDVPDRAALTRLITAGIITADGDQVRFS